MVYSVIQSYDEGKHSDNTLFSIFWGLIISLNDSSTIDQFGWVLPINVYTK